MLTDLADTPDADLPRQELFAPLGLTSATWEPDVTGTPVCSSYLWAIPRDWATIGEFALADGVWAGDRLLPEGWMKQTTTATEVTRARRRATPGAGGSTSRPTARSSTRPCPADAYWANGHDGQRLYVVPSAGLVVTRLGFSPEVDAKDLNTSQLVAELVAPAERTGSSPVRLTARR